MTQNSQPNLKEYFIDFKLINILKGRNHKSD